LTAANLAADGSRVIVSMADREAKTVAINPCEPHYIAVGASDPYVRVYDRRMLLTLSAGIRARGK
jgi:hypothetical protein